MTAILTRPDGKKVWECVDCGDTGVTDPQDVGNAIVTHWATCRIAPAVMDD